MSDKYDDQASKILMAEDMSPMDYPHLWRAIAAALRNMATDDRILASNLAILIAKMLDSRDTDAAALEVAHITLRDPDMRAAIEEARVFWKRVAKPSGTDDVRGG